jgi:hypothetical protein
MSRVSKSAAPALVIALCAAIIAVPAQAKTEQIKSGQTSVKLSPVVKALLAKTGLKVTPVGPAKAGGGSLSMPMKSGPMSVPSMNGKMKSKGGLRFRLGTRTLVIRDYMVTHHGKNASVSAIVHGKRITLARIVDMKVKMSGKHGTMKGTLRITAAWAHLINKLFGATVAHAGQDLGQLTMAVKMA